MKQIRIDMKVKELLNIKGQLNMNPAYQRDYIAGENKSWQRKLIGNLMKGEVVLPALYVRVNNKFQDMKGYDKNNVTTEQRDLIISMITEMIDGQQRTRTIYDYCNDVFSLGTLSYQYVDDYGSIETIELNNPTATDMKLDNDMSFVYDNFLNYTISVIATLGNDREVHQMFLDLNDLNNMTNQEKRNAMNTKIAEYVRNTARLNPHSLFKKNIENKGEYLSLPFTRMTQDEALAKAFAVVDGIGVEKGLGKTNLDKLYNMVDYSSTTKEFKLTTTHLTNILDKIYLMVDDKIHYGQLNTGCFTNLVMTVNDLLTDSNVKVKDWNKVGSWFFETHNMLMDINNPFNKDMKNAGLNETVFKTKTRLSSDREGMYIRSSMLKKNGMYTNDGVTLVDPKRVISDSEFEGVWYSFNKQCGTCKCDLPLHKAIKGHDIAHSKGVKKGGVTTIENTIPLCKSCNKVQVEDQSVLS